MNQFKISVTANGETVWEGMAADGLTLGRRSTNQCSIPERSVSGEHARVVELSGALFIEDLGSGNKTRIQDGPALGRGERARLADGMIIALGRARVRVALERSAEEDPEATLVQGGETATLERQAPESRTQLASPGTRGPVEAAASSESVYDSDSIETKVAPLPSARQERQAAPSTRAAAGSSQMCVVGPADAGAAPDAGGRARGPDSSSLTIGYQSATAGSAGGARGMAAGLEAMASMYPRLVFDDEVLRAIVPIEAADILIGRSRQAEIRVEHDGVSSRHARLRFDPASRSFLIEDLGSSNGTEVGGQALLAHQPAVLQPESHVRFGPVGALFVVDRDARGQELPEARFDLTLKILRSSAISAEIASAIKQAAKRSTHSGRVIEGGHVGERLILSGAVSAWEWSRAWEKARTFGVGQTNEGRDWTPYAIVAGAVLVLGALAWWVATL